MGRGLVLSGAKAQAFTYCQSYAGSKRVRWLNLGGEFFFRADERDEVSASSKAGAHAQEVTAPVPGKVVKILVKAGDVIQERQTILILESMKMEFEVQAARSGVLSEILVEAGQQVQADALLANWQSS